MNMDERMWLAIFTYEALRPHSLRKSEAPLKGVSQPPAQCTPLASSIHLFLHLEQ